MICAAYYIIKEMKNDKKRYPRVLYVGGYLLTLLMGSLHFGTVDTIVGYDISIFGMTQPLFMRMYGWGGSDHIDKQSTYSP